MNPSWHRGKACLIQSMVFFAWFCLNTCVPFFYQRRALPRFLVFPRASIPVTCWFLLQRWTKPVLEGGQPSRLSTVRFPQHTLDLSLKVSQDLVIVWAVFGPFSVRENTRLLPDLVRLFTFSVELLPVFDLIIHSFVACGSSFLECGGGLGNFLWNPLLPRPREGSTQYNTHSVFIQIIPSRPLSCSRALEKASPLSRYSTTHHTAFQWLGNKTSLCPAGLQSIRFS